MKRRKSLLLDMTPLVDVVFLLLIFFLVTSVFKKEELALLLNLPSAKEGEKVVEKKDISIELSEESVALNGQTLTLERLDILLADVKDKERPVVLRIDRHVRYGRITELFNILKRHELNNLVLVEEAEK
ncbi:biopolymer transport protein ExbD/TolR [Hydrogenimonas sp.]|nr:biopolymer transport protein ExbD/TolR [Hydrogenimonas sp.]